MRFIHMSDVRLGLHTESGRPWGSERRLELAENLSRVAEAAEDRGVDLVFVAGGLFAHRPVTKELEEANRIFASHPRITFIVTAGENDSVKKNSPVLSFDWAENVHYCVEGKGERITFPTLSTVCYVRSVTGEEGSVEDLMALLETDGNAEEELPPIRVGVSHESNPERASSLSGSGFSYVALGGLNAYTEVEKDRVIYCGGLEPEGMTDTGVHGYVYGEISPSTGNVTSLSFVPFASASYVPLLVKITRTVTPASFAQMIEREILSRGTSNIYRIRVTGQKEPGMEFDLKDLRARYRIAEVLDEAVPQYDFEALFEEHQQDMIGYFISTLRRRRQDLPDIDKKAMFAGIDALLKTARKEDEA